MSALLDRVTAHLDGLGLPHRVTAHAAATSTEHMADLRGAPVSLGVKALVMKAGGVFTVVALRAHHSLDNRALRHALGVSKLRFATRAELQELTGCAPGQVPPFGPPILPLPLVADQGVRSLPRMAFTAGTTTESVEMASEDWAVAAVPKWVAVASGENA